MRWRIFLLLNCFIFAGCEYNSENKIIKSNIDEWLGKEIYFPNKVQFSNQGVPCEQLNIEKSRYRVITYVDSIGCLSCKLQLRKWAEFINDFDSIPVLFYFRPSRVRELIGILRQNNFNYPVCVDELDSLNKLNHFPTDERFQTFLLDKDNKVLAIGNPVHNPKVKELYMKIILGDKAPKAKDKIKTTALMETSLIDFGEFDWKEEQKATFKLENTGAQPLVILDVTTSCGCISANFPKEPVTSGSEAEITVVYKADKPEHFNKTVTVYCNAENSPFTVKVIGTAK